MPILTDGAGRRLLLGTSALWLVGAGAASGGGSSGSSTYVVPAAIPLTMQAHGAPMAAGTVINTWPSFAQGHLPAASHLVVAVGGSTVQAQQDSATYWPDGSVRAARLAFRLPAALAADTALAHTVTPTAGAPATTALITPAALVAAKDITLRSYGGDAGAVTFVTSLREIVTNGPQTNWGANPIQGWELVASGPVEVVIRGWRMRHDSSQALTTGYHGWVRDMIYLSYRADGTYEAFARSEMGNWDMAVQNSAVTIATAATYQMVTACEMYDGATLIAAWGGAHDPRVATVAASTLNASTSVFTLPATMRPYQPFTLAPASGGALPSGLTAGTVYYAGTDGSLYTARAYATGETAGTKVSFGSAGSGNVILTPMLGVWNGTAATLCGSDGRPVLIGAARVDLAVAWDEAYLSKGARLFPCYDQVFTRYASTANTAPAVPYYPNWMPWGPWLNTTGDNAGDNRIGIVNNCALLSLLSPLDAAFATQARAQGCGWSDQPIWWSDPRSGRPMAIGNGPDDAGATYTNLGPNCPERAFNGDQDGWVGHRGGYYDGYSQGPIEPSHMPTPWVVPCLMTGSYIYADQGIGQAIAPALFVNPHNFTVSGTTYYYPIGQLQQPRGAGWHLNAACFAEIFTPASRPEAPFLAHWLDRTVAYYTAVQATTPANILAQGTFAPMSVNNTADGAGGFMADIFFVCASLQAWRGTRTGWMGLLAAWGNMAIGLVNDLSPTGGTGYIVSLAYHVPGLDGSGNVLTIRGIIGFYSSFGGLMPPYPASGMISGSEFLQPSWDPAKTTDYASIKLAVLGMCKTLGLVSLNGDNGAAVHDALRTRLNTTPCTGVEWSTSATDSHVAGPHAFPVWAIVAAS